MSPGKCIRLMFKRETLSMMNGYRRKVVNLYQPPFAMSWDACRNAVSAFQRVLSAIFFQFLWKKKDPESFRPFRNNRGGPSRSVCWD